MINMNTALVTQLPQFSSSTHTQSWLTLQFSIPESNDDPAHPSLHPSCNTISTKCYHTEKPIVRTGRKKKHLLEEFESFDHPTIA